MYIEIVHKVSTERRKTLNPELYFILSNAHPFYLCVRILISELAYSFVLRSQISRYLARNH